MRVFACFLGICLLRESVRIIVRDSVCECFSGTVLFPGSFVFVGIVRCSEKGLPGQ